MLTDLIIATPEEAAAILNVPGHASVWPTLEAKGLDPVKLATLRFILMKAEPADASKVAAYVKTFEALADEGEAGPWLRAVPEDLGHLLAQLPASDIPAVAAAWARTEELKLDGWHAADAEPFLGELSVFAAGAAAQGKRLLLWLCL